MFPEPIFDRIVLFWMGIAMVTFPVLLRTSAPYGRTVRKGWGPLISSRCGWVLMESAAVVSFSAVWMTSCRKFDTVSILFLFLWELHYLNRAYVFPLRMKRHRKGMALLVVVLALAFNVINGWINGTSLFSIGRPYPMAWLTDIRCILGLVLFFAGLAINVASDGLLLRQRRTGGGGYVVPRGFLFRFVSCPNYLGEVVEWLGWAILTWSLAGLSFFIWTCANLVPRALTYHRWYRTRFPEYPQERKAIIPFIL